MRRFPISTSAPLEYCCQPQADFSHRHLREDAQLEQSGVSRQGNMSTTPIAVLQRTRNRIIEYLELASSFDAQTRYQAAVPGGRVPNEVLNQWEDWANGDWLQYEPTFTPDEHAITLHGNKTIQFSKMYSLIIINTMRSIWVKNQPFIQNV